MIKYGVDWSVDFVLEGKNIPANFTMRIFQYPCIKPTEDIDRVSLSIRGTNGSLKVRGQIVSVQRIRRPRKAWTFGRVLRPRST